MSISIDNTDTNTHRREDPHHEFYKSWLQDLANGGEMFGLSSLVATAFIRIVTHPSFHTYPTPLVQAVSVIDSLLSIPSYVILGPGENHWSLVRRIASSRSPWENWLVMRNMPQWLWKLVAPGSRVIPILSNSGDVD